MFLKQAHCNDYLTTMNPKIGSLSQLRYLEKQSQLLLQSRFNPGLLVTLPCAKLTEGSYLPLNKCDSANYQTNFLIRRQEFEPHSIQGVCSQDLNRS